MNFCYADPPYIGQAKKHYSHDAQCAEVDHEALLARLENEFDGFALSCKSDARELAWLISLCKKDVRLGMWFKPFCSFKPNVNPAYAFEPVIWYSPRKRTRAQNTVRDWIEAPAIKENITLKKGLAGAKPRNFAFWVFDILNMNAQDELTDLFPGTGIISAAWLDYKMSLENIPVQLQLEAV